jgi:hypothetical protein
VSSRHGGDELDAVLGAELREEAGDVFSTVRGER